MNNEREIFGWTMYDWASSAFSIIVITTFFGPYISSLVEAQGGVSLLGFTIEGAAFFSFCVSISVLLQVFFLPFLGVVADYTNLRKWLLLSFAYVGAGATILLFFVQGELVLLGGGLFIIANLSFGAALVFYNAFLPDIASPDERDNVSSKGFALGYLGSGVLLFFTLFLFLAIEDADLVVRINFAIAGVWWLLFTYLFPHQRLLQREPARQLASNETYLSHTIKQLLTTFKELITKYPYTLRYLIAYLIYNDGIQTVIVISTLFATDELGATETTLTLLVLMIQFVAFFGTFLFNYVAKKVGAKQAIMISLLIWSALVIYGYAFLYDVSQLWLMGFIMALVLGGSQALSRSLFSQMIPRSHEAEYFSFYEVSERGTSWMGPLVFGLVVEFTESQRVALISMITFLVVGLLVLYFTDVKQAIKSAGNEVPAIL